MKSHIRSPAAREAVARVQHDIIGPARREVFNHWVKQFRWRSTLASFWYHLKWSGVAVWMAKSWIQPDLHVGIAWVAILCGSYTWHVVEEYRGRSVSILGFCAAMVAMGLGALGAAILWSWAL